MIVTIDFEASCLPRHGRSFPIEVGISGHGFTRSWLIRPHVSWRDWDWTDRAERIHGLSRALIEREGQSASTVLRELVACVGSDRVVADSLIDQYWLETLALAAGVTSPFAIDHVSAVMEAWGVDEAGIADAVAFANRACPARHRAAADAQWLFALLQHCAPARVQDVDRTAPAPALLAS